MQRNIGLFESRQHLANIRKDSERYSQLGLSSNPFPAGGLAPSNPQVEPWTEVRIRILQFLERFLETEASNGLVLLGSYGVGKTYHLNYIHSILDSVDFNVRIIHITDPGIHPYHLIRGILLDLGEEEIAKMMWSIIGPYLRQQFTVNPRFFDDMVSATVTPRSSKRKITPIGQQALDLILTQITEKEWSDHRLFLQALDKTQFIDRQQLLMAVRPVLNDRKNASSFITEIAQIAEDLAAICLYDGIPALERWKYLTEGVGLGSIQPGNERHFLTALLRLFRKNGIEYFVLLLDEFEKVPQLTRMTDKDSRSYLDTLRMLIDAAHEHMPFAYIVASNIDAWQLAVSRIEPLKDRFTTVDLPSMAEDDIARYTIKKYLDLVRLNSVSEVDTIAPFPDNFLELLPLNARITTRQLLKLCYHLIELAVERNHSTISEGLVKEVMPIPLSNYSNEETEGNTDE